jgi:hypothetical protein
MASVSFDHPQGEHDEQKSSDEQQCDNEAGHGSLHAVDRGLLGEPRITASVTAVTPRLG